jgi:hypothetical protein
MSDSQVLNKSAPPTTPVDGTLAGLVIYLLLVAVPISLKLIGITRVATWSWWKVIALLWMPWGLLGVMSVVGLLWHVATHRPSRALPSDQAI